MKKYIEWGREVLEAEIESIRAAGDRLGEPFARAVRATAACRGKVIVSGLGKSGHAGAKIAASLASLGTPAFFMHAAEALHGDSGMMEKRDLLIAISNSGATPEVVAVARKAKEIGMSVIAMTGKPGSALGDAADIVLDIAVSREADPLDLAPTSSSTLTLAMGDALAVAAARARGFTAADFAFRHPGGALGKKSKR